MIARLKSFLRAATRRSRLESDMAEELQFHLEARAADLERTGLTRSDALRQARVEFGPPATHIENMRHSLGLRWLDELLADLLYGARILRKSPGFTVIAVLSLGLAIGANTTIFSVANEMLYARLGVPHPEQLRLLTHLTDKQSAVHAFWGSSRPTAGGNTRMDGFSYPIYQALRRDNQVLGDLVAFKDTGRANVTVDGTAQPAQIELLSGNFYDQLDVHPALGRAILPADDVPTAAPVVILSDAFWARAFARSPSVLGKVITVNMTPVTVIGVNPRGFTGAKSAQNSPDLFLPLSMISLVHGDLANQGPLLKSTSLWWLQVMARTKPGVTQEQARASLDVALTAAVRATMTPKAGETMPRLILEDGSKGLNFTGNQYAQPMYVLLGMVGFLLLLACANIANLMLARASARQREVAVRLALGAGRARILRQLLTEALMLSSLGGALGLLLGYVGRTALPRLMANAWEVNDVHVPFDWRVFAFTAGITVLTGLLFGLAPAWGATRSQNYAQMGTALKEGAKSATRRRKGLSGKAIVAFQVALSTLLVTGAVLFLRTLVNLYSVDAGFNTTNLVLFDLNPPTTRYPAPKDVALQIRIEDALRAVPGVDGVTLSDIPLVAQSMARSLFQVEGRPEAVIKRGDEMNLADYADVGPDFLSVMQIPLIAGRTFNASDTASTPQASIINEALAKKLFPNENPIGKRFTNEGAEHKDRTWFTIVGICGDTLYTGLKDAPEPLHFDLYRQQKEIGGVTFIVRSKLKPESIVPSLRAAVQGIDRDIPLIDIRTQRQQIDATIQQERLFASLTAAFGVLALALACVGIYGIMAYTVSQRTNEIGIRLALGAERGQVRGMVVKETTWLAGIGVAGGLSLALVLGRVVKTMLYGLKPADPISLAGSALLLIAVATAAGWIPALRASRVEPMEALRHE